MFVEGNYDVNGIMIVKSKRDLPLSTEVRTCSLFRDQTLLCKHIVRVDVNVKVNDDVS